MRIYLRLFPLLLLFILLHVQATPHADRTLPNETNTMAPSLIGHVGGETRAVAVRNGYAYLGVGSRVAVFDVHDPAQALKIGATGSLGGIVDGLMIDGNHLYVNTGRLLILDLTDPANPMPVGAYDGYISQFLVRDGWAYLLVGNCELLIVDVRDPSAPVPAGAPLGLPYLHRDWHGIVGPMFLIDERLYIPSAIFTGPSYVPSYVQVVDVSQPSRPWVATVRGPLHVRYGHMSGGYGYAFDSRRLVVVDMLSDEPTVVAELDLLGRFAYGDEGLLLVLTEDGLMAIDIGDPLSPQIVGGPAPVQEPVLGPDGRPSQGVVRDGWLYLAQEGLRIVSISDPTAMTQAAWYRIPFLWEREAENGVIEPPMRVEQDPAASGGKYVLSPSTSGAVSFTVDIPYSGYYQIWARVRGAGYAHNSFFLSVDDGPPSHYEFPPFTEGWVWGWHEVYADAINAPPFWLDAGERTLRFAAREADSRLDKVLLTDDPDFIPDPPPPAPLPTPTPSFTPMPTPTRSPFEGSVRPMERIYESAEKVLVEGELAYTTAGSTLSIWDLSDPSAPILLGTTGSVGSLIGPVRLSGSHVYLGTHKPSLVIVDVSTPTNPIVVSETKIPGPRQFQINSTADIVIHNGIAYCAVNGSFTKRGSDSWLTTVDISDPMAPAVISVLQSRWGDAGAFVSDAFGYQIPDDRLYVMEFLAGSGWIGFLNIEDPFMPTWSASFELQMPGWLLGFCVDGPYVYVVGLDQLQVIDWSTSPEIIATLDVGGTSPFVDGNRLYVWDEDTIIAIDITNPSAPYVLDRSPAPPTEFPTRYGEVIRDVPDGRGLLLSSGFPVVIGDHAYVNEEDGLHILNVTIPENPVVATYPLSETLMGFDVLNNLACLVDREGWLHVLDVSNPREPSRIGITQAWAPQEHPRSRRGALRMTQNHAYVGITYGYSDLGPWGVFLVVDLNDPTAPQVVSEMTVESPQALRVCNDTLLMINHARFIEMNKDDHDDLLTVWDISDPERPQQLGHHFLWAPTSPQCGLATWARSIACAGDYAYVGVGLVESWINWPSYQGGALLTLDLSDPTRPIQIGAQQMPVDPAHLEVVGARLYSDEGSDGIVVYELPFLDEPEMTISTVGDVCAQWWTTFVVRVRNTGETPMTGVVVRSILADVPLDIRSIGPATYENSTLTWMIGRIDPGQEKALAFEVRPYGDTAGSWLEICTTVTSFEGTQKQACSDFLILDCGPTPVIPTTTATPTHAVTVTPSATSTAMPQVPCYLPLVLK